MPSQSRSGVPRTMNFTSLLLAGLIIAVLAGQASADQIRFATFNASMNRSADGELAAALQAGDDPQIIKVAAIVRAVDPDVILINEFDYGAGNDRVFVRNYLRDAYPFSFIAPSNTGLATGIDLDGDGIVGNVPGTIELAKDSHGFGTFEGQYGMAVLSKHAIDLANVRTFRTFLWRDMPGARLPVNPDGTPYHSAEALEVLRLSSKGHWDLPLRFDETIVHLLVGHPTPPVFDGPEDRNGARNADEIRFWSDYIAGGRLHPRRCGPEGWTFRRRTFRHRRRPECRSFGRRIRPGSDTTTARTPAHQRRRDTAERRWRHRGDGAGWRKFDSPRGPAIRHRGFRRREARKSAGGLRAAFGGPGGRGGRGVLAGGGCCGSRVDRCLRPPSGLDRRPPAD